MSDMSAREARANFSELVSRVSYGNERIIIRRRNKKAVAMITIDDLDLLEMIEDHLDLVEAKKALKEAERKGDKPISWEQARKELGV